MNAAREIRRLLLATAGHVDHGKSTLVRALTGIDPDRLPEEKKRGITIDLGFAHFDLASPDDPAVTFRIGIVDVPGHEDFIKNMVAGVGSVDAALIAVAADDGWMPQSEEHLRILEYLGLTRAAVALTKADLLPSPAAQHQAIDAIYQRLKTTAFAGAAIVPTFVDGRGIEELRQSLASLLGAAPLAADASKPRLPIDRVFTLRGIGTVVTGTLSGGRLKRGQTVVIQPGGQTARVRTLHSYGQEVECALPGSRVALNLPDLPAQPPDAPHRGCTATIEHLGKPTLTLDAALLDASRASLKHGARVAIHLGSGRHAARLYPAGDGSLAQLRFEDPVFVFVGDRFVVRDDAGRRTLTGGIALDPDPVRRGWREPARLRFLAARAQAPNDPVVLIKTLLDRDQFAERQTIGLQSRCSAAEIEAALQKLSIAGTLVLTPALAIQGEWWRAFLAQAASMIDDWHRARPELPGMPLTSFKSRLMSGAALRRAGIFEALVADLARTGFAAAGGCIRRDAHVPVLPERLRHAVERVRATLLEQPLEPPSRAQLAPDAATQSAVRFLLEAGEAVELGPTIVLLAGSFSRLRNRVVRRLREQGSMTVSELRIALNSTRRILVPLLEKLDRDGLTVRDGDQRKLREALQQNVLVDRAWTGQTAPGETAER